MTTALLIRVYLVFSLFYGVIHLIYGFSGTLNNYYAPIWLVLSRDLVFFLIASIFIYLSRPTILPKDLIIFFIALLGLALISAIHMYFDFMGSVQHNIRNLLMYSLFFIVVPMLQLSTADINKIFYTFIGAMKVVSIIAILSVWSDFGIYFGRAISTIGNPNTLAALLCLGIFMITSKILINQAQVKSKDKVALVLMFIALLLTGSFSNFLLLSLGLVVQLTIVMRFRMLSFRALFWLVGFSSVITIILINLGLLESLIARFDSIFIKGEGTSISGRINQYQELFAFNNTIELLLGRFASYSTHDGMYVQLIQKNGIFGLSLYIVLVLYIALKVSSLFKYLVASKGHFQNIMYASLGFLTFILAEVFLGFFATAMFYRFPVNAIFFLFAGLLFSESIAIKRQSDGNYQREMVI